MGRLFVEKKFRPRKRDLAKYSIKLLEPHVAVKKLLFNRRLENLSSESSTTHSTAFCVEEFSTLSSSSKKHAFIILRLTKVSKLRHELKKKKKNFERDRRYKYQYNVLSLHLSMISIFRGWPNG